MRTNEMIRKRDALEKANIPIDAIEMAQVIERQLKKTRQNIICINEMAELSTRNNGPAKMTTIPYVFLFSNVCNKFICVSSRSDENMMTYLRAR